MTGLSAFRVLGTIFPAVFGGGSLYLGYVSIMFISGADKHYGHHPSIKYCLLDGDFRHRYCIGICFYNILIRLN